MAHKISLIPIAFLLLWMVCITSQKKTRHQKICSRLVKQFTKLSCKDKNARSKKCERNKFKLKKKKCEFKIPGTFRNIYFGNRTFVRHGHLSDNLYEI